MEYFVQRVTKANTVLDINSRSLIIKNMISKIKSEERSIEVLQADCEHFYVFELIFKKDF